MKKSAPFIIIFLVAYLLAKILFSVFGFAGFSLDDPTLFSLVADLLCWGAAWTVSAIVYVTVRDAIASGLRRKKERQEEEEGGELHEIS